MDSSTRTEKNPKRREKAQNQRALAYVNVSPMKKKPEACGAFGFLRERSKRIALCSHSGELERLVCTPGRGVPGTWCTTTMLPYLIFQSVSDAALAWILSLGLQVRVCKRAHRLKMPMRYVIERCTTSVNR